MLPRGRWRVELLDAMMRALLFALLLGCSDAGGVLVIECVADAGPDSAYEMCDAGEDEAP